MKDWRKIVLQNQKSVVRWRAAYIDGERLLAERAQVSSDKWQKPRSSPDADIRSLHLFLLYSF